MKYNFDEIIERRGSNSIKHDHLHEYFNSENLIPMWVADMDFRTPDFVMDAIRNRTGHEILGYSKRPDSFYHAITDWYSRRQGWYIEKEWIVFTPGVVPALSFAVKAFSAEGDKIIIQPPVYHPFFSVIKDNNRIIINSPLTFRNGRYFMDLDGLAKKIDSSTRLMLLCHPHNPIGRIWSVPELKELGDLCRKNNIVVVSDEIHSDLVLPGHKHIPFTNISPDLADISISCIAPSKTFNIAGLSTSVAVISNPGIREKFSREIDTSHLWLGNIFGNVALEAAYNQGDEWLDQLMEYINGNISYLGNYLENNIPVVKLIKPEATYLAWLDMRELKMNNKELREFLIRKAHIACNDGPSFGPGGEGFQRMNVACPISVLHKALEQIKQAVATL